MILVLLGPPGVGKGTQAARIALHYELPTISTGVMFRDAVARGTELGRIIQRYRIEKGEFVPDDVVIAAVQKRTDEPDCKKGFLLDGFPRTIVQSVALDTMLAARHQCLSGVLEFTAPIELVVGRFSGRRVCPTCGTTYHIVNQPPIQPGLCDLDGTPLITRPDDDPVVVEKRQTDYINKTAPLRELYRQRGILHTIDASVEPETVFGHVIEILEQLK